jgi:hypothetical protein
MLSPAVRQLLLLHTAALLLACHSFTVVTSNSRVSRAKLWAASLPSDDQNRHSSSSSLQQERQQMEVPRAAGSRSGRSRRGLESYEKDQNPVKAPRQPFGEVFVP